jgi:hypothetical protein
MNLELHELATVGVTLALSLLAGCGADPTTSPAKLTNKDDGDTVVVAVETEAQLTLGTIGPGQYGEPQISSEAVAFEGVELASLQNPGGPTQIYVFRCVRPGAATITIPHTAAAREFSFVIDCK